MASWRVCHFCERFGDCEPWFSRWRCTACRQASEFEPQGLGPNPDPDAVTRAGRGATREPRRRAEFDEQNQIDPIWAIEQR